MAPEPYFTMYAGILAEGEQVRDAAAHDFKLRRGSAAIDRGARVFVPWSLCAVVGEWGFYRHPADPAVILGDNIHMNDEWFNRNMFQDIPRNNLKGHGIDASNFKVGTLENWVEGALALNGVDEYCDIPLHAGIKAVQPFQQTEVILRDSNRRPVVTRRSQGAGLVYFQAADLIGYGLAEVCGVILSDAAKQRGRPTVPNSWRLAEIRSAHASGLATNVLLSRRSYATHHAFLLMNRDEYERAIRLRVPGLTGNWRVNQPLAAVPETKATGADLASTGVRIDLAPGGPAVVLLESL